MGAYGAGQSVIEFSHVGHAAAQDDHVRVDHVADHGQAPGQAVHIAGEGVAGPGLSRQGARHHLLGGRAMVPGQAGARDIELHAASPAAPAFGPGVLLGRGPGQGHVAPLAGHGVATLHQPPVHHHPGAATGAQDRGEHHPMALARAVHRLGQGQAVGVVGVAYRPG